jgi:hypothetical protein
MTANYPDPGGIERVRAEGMDPSFASNPIPLPTLVQDLADKFVQVDLNGRVEVPWIGRVKAAGETVLSLSFGPVTTSGIHRLRRNKALVEVLSFAGTPRPGSGIIVRPKMAANTWKKKQRGLSSQ